MRRTIDETDDTLRQRPNSERDCEVITKKINAPGIR